MWVSSHSGASNPRVNTNGENKKQNTTEKADELVHQGEIEIMKQKYETSEVMEELKWPTHEDLKVKDVKSKADNLDLMEQNYRAELLGYHRLKPLKEEEAELLDTDGEKEHLKSADSNMKAEIKEIVEQENSGDDELDWETWYFAWR